MARVNGSDLLIAPGRKVYVKRLGSMVPLGDQPLTGEQHDHEADEGQGQTHLDVVDESIAARAPIAVTMYNAATTANGPSPPTTLTTCSVISRAAQDGQ